MTKYNALPKKLEGQRGEGSRLREGPGDVPRAQPLGIYARTDSAQEIIDQTTGLITRFKVNEKTREHVEDIDPRQFRWERFALKSVVNRLLPTSRTSKCMRWRVPHKQLQVLKSREHNKAFFSGLEVCASVWACPVCAAKISERRRAELVTALALAKARGWDVFMMTLTIPHGMGDELSALLEQIHKAWRSTSTSRAGQKLRKLLGVRGTVRALEVTHGQNGFHPHLHVLLFLDQDFSPQSVQNAFAPLWQQACERVGLPRPSDAHGCRVDDGSHAAKYAAKWGLESELTKSHTKKGKSGSRTPWDFLRSVLGKLEGWEQSAHLFRTYAEAFKGKRQLYWSNGLRDLLAMGAEETDKETAEKEIDRSYALADLTADHWRAILRTKSESAVLDIAEAHPEALPAMLESLCLRYQRLTVGTG